MFVRECYGRLAGPGQFCPRPVLVYLVTLSCGDKRRPGNESKLFLHFSSVGFRMFVNECYGTLAGPVQFRQSQDWYIWLHPAATTYNVSSTLTFHLSTACRACLHQKKRSHQSLFKPHLGRHRYVFQCLDDLL